MGRTKIQNDQSVNAAALPVSRKAANTDTKDILSGFDTNFNSPLRLFASNPSDAKLNIESNTVTKADGTAVSSPPSQSNVPTVPLTTINFQTGATTGATFDSLTFPTTTVGQYRRLALSLKSNGEIKAQWSDASATLAGLANAGSLFPSTSINIPIGWIDLQATAATAYKTAGSATSIIENSVSGSPRIYNVGQGSGSGGAGTSLRPNYISNPDAEFDSLGWVTYKDAVASAPEDGVGGSASILWQRSTTSPIRGVSDFNFVKGAANRRGEGVAFRFSVERGDLAKQLTISFDYELLSGTFETGDLSVYIIQDPTGTPVVIQPGAHLISAGAVGKTMSHMASFQTDSSVTNYALVFHVASASAQAYSIAFDSISVKNESVYFGSYTQIGARYSSTTGQSIASGATPTRLSFPTRESETLTNVSTSPEWKFTAPVSGLYQIECSANFASSTFTTPSDVSMYLYKKNDKHSLMQSKRVTPIVTEWQDFPSVAAGTLITGVSSNPSYGSVAFNRAQWRRVGDSMEIRWDFKQTTPGTAGSGIYLFNLPTGYSIDTSKALVSSTSEPSKSLGTFSYNDGNAGYGTGWVSAYSSNRLKMMMQFQNSNNTSNSIGTIGSGYGALTIGLVEYSISARVPISGWSSSVDSLSISGSTSLSLLAGEWIDVRLAHGETVAKSLSTSATDNYISIQRVSGPPSVAAAESTVGLLVEGNQSGTLSNTTFNKVTFGTVTTDSLGGYSSGTYTVQVPGLYDITATVSTTATYAAGEKLVASVFVDGVEKARGQAFSASPGVQGPVGQIVTTGSTTPPDGCLYADGSAVSRTTYADLFAAIGTTYGDGTKNPDGSNSIYSINQGFNLPNLKGVFLRGAGSQIINGITYAGVLGTKQGDQMQSHKHFPMDPALAPSGKAYQNLLVALQNFFEVPGYGNVANGTYVTSPPIVDRTNGTPRTGSETRPANVAVAYHIRFTATPFTIALTSSSSVNVKAVNLKAGQTVDIRVLQEGTGATFNNTQKANFSLSRVAGPFAVPTGNTRGGNLTTDVFTGDGVTKSFTLSTIPSVEANVQVYISGVYQSKNSFTIFGSTITFDEAPPVGESNIEVVSGEPLDINVPGDDTVSTVKIKDLNVTGAKLADESVSFAKLASDVTNKFSAGYIANGSAEVDTAGWLAYNDSSGASPLDGVDGSSSITWTRSTTSPLKGVASFRLAVPANTIGQGWAYNFSITRSDQAKVLTITFDYEVVTGTYPNNAMTVWIYDVTNSQLIQPAGYQIENVATGVKNKFIATFQTSATGVNYRLILHSSVSSASSYTLALDEINVSPQTAVYGAPVTDWEDYTPTISGVGTPTSVLFKYRRVGDSLEIYGRFACGTVTATTAALTFPSGLVASENIQHFAGNWIRNNPNANAAKRGWVSAVPLSGSLNFHQSEYVLAQVPSTSQNGNNLWSNSEVIWVDAKVKIAGWGSSLQLSDSTDTRVVAAIFGGSAVSATANTPFKFSSVSRDTHAGYSTSTGLYTVPVSGFYSVSVNADTGITAGQGAYISVNGTTAAGLNRPIILANSGWINSAATVYVEAGGTISIRPTVTATAAAASNISIERLSGPSVIAATETVAFYYKLSSNYSYTANSAVYCNSKIFDTHGSFRVGTAISGSDFVAPVSGIYKIKASIDMTGSTGYQVGIYKNDVAYGEKGWIEDAGSHEWLIDCNAGDRIYFSVVVSGTVDATYTSFSGYKIK
jgi:microcystin-dependent protein